METLAPKFHVVAADSYGAGKSPAWPTHCPVCLQDEVALLEPVFARAGNPFALVAHSYGAAVALIAAVSQPQRIRSLALYEPTLFALLDAESPPPMRPMGSARLWLAPLLRLTPPILLAPRSVSSTSGWAKALVFTCLNHAKAQLPLPSPIFAGGQGRCSMNPHPLQHSPS